VSGQSQDAATVYDDKTGPALDLYYKGALIAHTLRLHIGDDAFYESLRRLVYGRPDPRPGNFQPRYATTPEYVTIVNEVTGRDLGWFFDAYLYQAALPDLIMTRQGDQVTLEWKTGNGRPFPLPVEVEVDGLLRALPMTDGRATFEAPPGAHILLDPGSKVLRRLEYLERWKAASTAD
jgi:aminopeptidase N